MNIHEIAEEYREKLVSYRRYLHQNPELSFEEVHTAAWVREHLKELGIPMVEGVRGNSTVGVLKGQQPGPVLLFRADIDALPITEENDLEFRSKVPGIMHACGHDAHTTVLMCMADFLSKHPELVKGTVKFVFQQGEEQTPGGAKLVVEDGILDDVDYVFSWHCAPEIEVGTVVAAGGPRSASFDNFEIYIEGKGGHASTQSHAIDVTSTGALVVTALNQLIPWTVEPLDSTTLIITHMNTGQHELYNVIPDKMVIEGNVRCLNNETAERIIKRIQEVSEQICAAKNCKCRFVRLPGYPALINDEALTDRLSDALKRNGIHAITTPPYMIGEDFAYYLLKKPGTYFNVGSYNPEKSETACLLHNPNFCLDESVMVYAMETLLVTYLEMV